MENPFGKGKFTLRFDQMNIFVFNFESNSFLQGAYRSFFSYLKSDPMISVVGIPEDQLKIASLGKARLERGFPSPRTLISKGVPRGLAKALAPFQRGGVDFIYEKEGRALIADGK